MKNSQLFISSLGNFSNLKEARKMPFWKVLIYLVFLGIILALPIAKQMVTIFSSFQNDSKEIAAKIPDFHISDGELVVDKGSADGFIFQTDTIIFTFDPEGKRSVKEISDDLVGNLISIGFTDKELVFSTADSEITQALLGSNVYEVPYTNETLKGLTSDELKSMLTEMKLPMWGYLLLFFILLYPVLFNLIITLLITTLCSIIYTKMRRLDLKFFESLKIMIYCATLPSICSTVLSFFLPAMDFSMVVTLVTLLIFYRALRNIEPKPLA